MERNEEGMWINGIKKMGKWKKKETKRGSICQNKRKEEWEGKDGMGDWEMGGREKKKR